ncbi:MAG: beta-ketoacyl synthase N-terminal-like domain-containing protein [Vicinamibacterales bacterium]
MTTPIVITGLGVVSPFGDSVEMFRDALLEGRTAIAPDPAFTEQGSRSVLAARIAGFEAAKWIPPMKLRRMDETGPLALVIARQAAAQAGYPLTDAGDDRAGVVLGTYSAGGQATTDYLTALFAGGPTGAPALLFNSTVGNAAAGLTGLELKLRGPNATLAHKEASGLAAIVTAADLLREERLDAVIAGGIDSIYDLFYRVHDRFGVLNRAREPGASTAPFDASRGGFVLGEGGFGLWLERADVARARGATAVAEVAGVASSSAAVPLNAWPDRTEPLVRTMRLALADAGLSARDVDVVYAAANASPGLDGIEAQALTELFGGSRTIVTAIKGAIGESGAASAAGCVAAVACGMVGRIPPVAGLRTATAETASLRLATAASDGPARVALVNGIASGGALFSVILRVLPVTASGC